MLKLNTFGEQKYWKQNCDLVKNWLSKPGLNEEVEISELSFPVICSSLQSKVDISKFPQLETLQLANEFNNGNNDLIDVLFGSDHYWNIAHGETIRCKSGPTAISSKLGWLLSSPGGESVGNAHCIQSFLHEWTRSAGKHPEGFLEIRSSRISVTMETSRSSPPR